jgi:hypothetical protein
LVKSLAFLPALTLFDFCPQCPRSMIRYPVVMMSERDGGAGAVG